MVNRYSYCLILFTEGLLIFILWFLNLCSDIGKGKESQPSNGNNRKCGAARSFPFRELAMATRGFKEVNLIGEGGFGRVYKGRLGTGQVVLAASFFYHLHS